MKQTLTEKTFKHIQDKEVIWDSQHGFIKGKLCWPIWCLPWWSDCNVWQEMTNLKFCKAFNMVPLRILISRLERHAFVRWTIWWIWTWLEGHRQWVVVNGSISRWQVMSPGVCLWVGALQYHYQQHRQRDRVHIQQVCRWPKAEWRTWHSRRKGCHSEGPGQTREMGIWELLELQEVQVRYAAPGSGQFQIWAQAGERIHWLQLCEEEFKGSHGWNAEHEPTACFKACQLTPQKANFILESIKRWMISRLREVILPSTYEISPGILHPDPGLQHEKDMNMLEQVQRRATKMVRGLEHLSCGGRLR